MVDHGDGTPNLLYAAVAQLVEQLISNQQVESPSLSGGSHGAVPVSTAMICIKNTGMQSSLSCKRKKRRRLFRLRVKGCLISLRTKTVSQRRGKYLRFRESFECGDFLLTA